MWYVLYNEGHRSQSLSLLLTINISNTCLTILIQITNLYISIAHVGWISYVLQREEISSVQSKNQQIWSEVKFPLM